MPPSGSILGSLGGGALLEEALNLQVTSAP